jgi:hypothetical protein
MAVNQDSMHHRIQVRGSTSERGDEWSPGDVDREARSPGTRREDRNPDEEEQMSTPERTDDPGEHGYGAAEKDSENLIGEDGADTGEPESVEANPSRRHRHYELDADRRPTK